MQQLMTEEIAKTVPRLYEQDGAEDPTVYAHYFSCVNGWDWWLLEFDGTDEALGLVEGYDDELGYFSIKEMAELNRQMGFAAVERDEHFSTGILRMAGRSAASGMARYPLATVAGHALDGMGGLTETLEEALGSTVVVEYESGGDGGAFEAGTAPAGSAELERLIAAARSEADALATAGGWAAVRVGFGDAETIDCETGRTVYVAG